MVFGKDLLLYMNISFYGGQIGQTADIFLRSETHGH